MIEIAKVERIPACEDDFWKHGRYRGDDIIILYDDAGEISRIPVTWPYQPVSKDGSEILADSLKAGDKILAPGQELYSAREICRFMQLTPKEFSECQKLFPLDTATIPSGRKVRIYDLGTFCQCFRWINQYRQGKV